MVAETGLSAPIGHSELISKPSKAVSVDETP